MALVALPEQLHRLALWQAGAARALPRPRKCSTAPGLGWACPARWWWRPAALRAYVMSPLERRGALPQSGLVSHPMRAEAKQPRAGLDGGRRRGDGRGGRRGDLRQLLLDGCNRIRRRRCGRRRACRLRRENGGTRLYRDPDGSVRPRLDRYLHRRSGRKRLAQLHRERQVAELQLRQPVGVCRQHHGWKRLPEFLRHRLEAGAQHRHRRGRRLRRLGRRLRSKGGDGHAASMPIRVNDN